MLCIVFRDWPFGYQGGGRVGVGMGMGGGGGGGGCVFYLKNILVLDMQEKKNKMAQEGYYKLIWPQK